MPNANDGPIAGYPNSLNKTAVGGDTIVGPLSFANQTAAPSAAAGVATMYATGGVLTYVNPQGLVNTMVGSQGGLQTAGITTVANLSVETVLRSEEHTSELQS